VSDDLGEAMARAARAIHTPLSLDETLCTIADTALLSLPSFDAAGVCTIDKHGKAHTRAATRQLVWELDRLQYELSEGPCVDSLRDADVVTAPELRHDQRWPRYVPGAVGLGVKSQLAARLYLDDEGTLGGLNLYSTTSAKLPSDTEHTAELFATHAAIALGSARQLEGLNEALQTRSVIGQAIGILMHRYTLDGDSAFSLLIRTSSHANVKLRIVAERLVSAANARAAESKQS
jgi:GAF domain-containing protein